jgi:hypothetical protein
MYSALELEVLIDRTVCERLTEVRRARTAQRAMRIAQAEKALARLRAELGDVPQVRTRGGKQLASECG